MLMHAVFALLSVSSDVAAGSVPAASYDFLLADTRISESQARAIAVQALPGAVRGSELIRVDTRWVYAVRIEPVHPNRRESTVRVDARDGSVVATIPVR